MANPLHHAECLPAKPGEAPLPIAEADSLLEHLDQWTIQAGKYLRKAWAFSDFQSALNFVNAIGHLAESVGHHPDIALGWGRVEVELTTHDIGGLHRADFILAARIDLIEL